MMWDSIHVLSVGRTLEKVLTGLKASDRGGVLPPWVTYGESLNDPTALAGALSAEGRRSVVFVDAALPHFREEPSAKALLEEIGSWAPVIAIVPPDDTEAGTRFLENGAHGYLGSDTTSRELVDHTLREAIYQWQRECELRRLKEQAEEATRLKDKFVSLAAHDLRGPLGAILGLIEVMTLRKDPPLPDVYREGLEFILANGRNLLDVVQDILELSRIQTGMIVPELSFLDGHFAVDRAEQKVALLASQKGVAIQNSVPPGTRLRADATLFGQVLQNLLSNAIKFSKAGDRIDLFVPDGRPSVIAVRDQGVGIQEDKLPKLFVLEEKVSTVGTAGEKGTGFGLPLSHRIMQALGGDLTVTSRVGEGATFFASLPDRVPHVLVVDDDQTFCRILTTRLQAIGVTPVVVADGRQALDYLGENGDVHLIITDIEMPVMDGFALMRALKESAATAQIPVIVITGDDEIATRHKALELGAADFTVKPIQREDLIPRVRRFVG